MILSMWLIAHGLVGVWSPSWISQLRRDCSLLRAGPCTPGESAVLKGCTSQTRSHLVEPVFPEELPFVESPVDNAAVLCTGFINQTVQVVRKFMDGGTVSQSSLRECWVEQRPIVSALAKFTSHHWGRRLARPLGFSWPLEIQEDGSLALFLGNRLVLSLRQVAVPPGL
jgi:hypothetical protein